MAEKQDKYDLVTINPGLVIGPTLSGRGTASYDYIKDILGGKWSLVLTLPSTWRQ